MTALFWTSVSSFQRAASGRDWLMPGPRLHEKRLYHKSTRCRAGGAVSGAVFVVLQRWGKRITPVPVPPADNITRRIHAMEVSQIAAAQVAGVAALTQQSASMSMVKKA